MNKTQLSMIGAVFTAFLSTLCCLPAFLFLFFGISSGVLTYFTSLEFLRIPMGIITLILLILSLIQVKRKISCSCSKEKIYKQYGLFFIFFICLFSLLFYPELIPMFMD